MKVYYSIQDFNPKDHYVVTQGTFDGVHLGHQKILKKIVEKAKNLQLESILLTFHPHPRSIIFNGEQNIKMLNTIEEKIKLIEQMGIDHLIISPFTKEFSRTSAFNFIKDILVEKLKVKHFVIGYDHRFGKNREGSIDDLKKHSEIFNYTLHEIEAKEVHESIISSTKIRIALEEGKVNLTKKFLGKAYSISGKVIKGKGRGKLLNFPTANIEIIQSEKLIPKHGVYAVIVNRKNTRYKAMMNIGFNPTFDQKEKSLEVHLFNFNENIYGETIRIYFHEYLRHEQKFETKEDLSRQLKLDKKNAEKGLQNA